ncbi:unnamed protein product [Merluccius merluccius]
MHLHLFLLLHFSLFLHPLSLHFSLFVHLFLPRCRSQVRIRGRGLGLPRRGGRPVSSDYRLVAAVCAARQMDKFTIQGYLAKGPRSLVYECREDATGHRFAVKKFGKQRTWQLNRTIAVEYELLRRLRHDNVVKVVGMFLEDMRAHIVLELLDHSVSDDMRRQPGGLESELLRKYAFQLLRAMEYLHSNNVIHRDIKPSNLLVSGSGVVKVADLGSGRLVHPGKGQTMSLGMGTLWYLSPESLTGDRFYSMSHDVWAIGCTILAMARSKPFIRSFSQYSQIMMEVYSVGYLTKQQEQGFIKTFPGYELPQCKGRIPPADLQRKYHLSDPVLAQLSCLKMDPDTRATCSELLGHQYFTCDSFDQRFSQELAELVQADRTIAELQDANVAPVATALPDDGLCSMLSLEDPSTTESQKKDSFKAGCRRILRRIRRGVRLVVGLQLIAEYVDELTVESLLTLGFNGQLNHVLCDQAAADCRGHQLAATENQRGTSRLDKRS